jgi:hypothetical protein
MGGHERQAITGGDQNVNPYMQMSTQKLRDEFHRTAITRPGDGTQAPTVAEKDQKLRDIGNIIADRAAEAKDFLEACGVSNSRELLDALGVKHNPNKENTAGNNRNESSSQDAVERLNQESRSDSRSNSSNSRSAHDNTNALEPLRFNNLGDSSNRSNFDSGSRDSGKSRPESNMSSERTANDSKAQRPEFKSGVESNSLGLPPLELYDSAALKSSSDASLSAK